MQNEFQINETWDEMLASESRSLYFADLASRYTVQKQWITGASFFLASGAAATVIGKAPEWLPAILSVAVALVTAYSIAVNLDGKIKTMCSLHSMWDRIATDYADLWSNVHSDEAESKLRKIVEMERAASEMAVSEAPNDQKLLAMWQDRVFALHHLTGQHG
jgi:hypothetical protein